MRPALNNFKTNKDGLKMVRVIVDASNARKDYWLPESIARGCYEKGLLAWDLTNISYCEKERANG